MGFVRTATAVAASAAIHAQSVRGPRAPRAAHRDAALGLVITGEFGSLGDQALVAGAEEELERGGHTWNLLAPGPAAPWAAVTERPTYSETGRLALGGTVWRPRHLAEAAPGGIIMIGADSMDGAYGVRGVSVRISALNLAARAGGVASLVNFSMRETVPPGIARLIRSLDPRVRLVARDRLSASRLRKTAPGREVDSAPDVAILLRPLVSQQVRDFLALVRRRNENQLPVAALVPNRHLAGLAGGRAGDDVAYFRACARVLLDAGYFVILLAHDVRPRPGDPHLIARVESSLADRNVLAVLPRSAPEAKAVLATTELVVSARMHAAVASLSSGVPTIGLDYLDKFCGQFEWYGMERYVTRWTDAFSDDSLASLVHTARDTGAALRRELAGGVAAALAVPRNWLP
ncbi:MAG: hypothetical protein JWR33_720 [Naasia sp.]|uniref:polysaccharide pyruvyl transferase family protein n=1 Tax=Naasia sp. TaxID=2546198 RepID=UPI00262624D2|nr:polysaccharide pyruvyl transferase family protein [Naasia sp.]MCU1569979.1 hypothetical protein [Naasia sp.]